MNEKMATDQHNLQTRINLNETFQNENTFRLLKTLSISLYNLDKHHIVEILRS